MPFCREAPAGPCVWEKRGAKLRAVMPSIVRRRPPHLAALLGLGLAIAWPSAATALGGAQSRAETGLAPHLVMVLTRDGNRHGACTGTIVARDVVLTAAHCVAGKRQVVVAYGENGGHVLQRVVQRAIHPGFSGRSRVSIDLALIRLDGPLPGRFQPLALDRGEGQHRVGLSQKIAGFGMQRDGEEASAGTLRSASVSVLPRLFPRFLRLGTDPEADLSDIAICTGDSGGPVIEERGEGPLIVAVVYGRERFGQAKTCGTVAQAVRLAPQAGWINKTLQGWSGAGQNPRRPGQPLRISTAP